VIWFWTLSLFSVLMHILVSYFLDAICDYDLM
jgi:hypothetical protein